MSRRIRFFPECHADTTLVGFLLNNGETLYRHSRGSEVSGDMKAASQAFEVVVGIIDDDKHKPRYFDDFIVIREDNNVRFLRLPQREVYLIVIVGNGIESFLLWNAAQVNINLEDYGFETTPKRMKARFKSVGIENDPNYYQLLADLRTQNAPSITTLDQLLHDLIPIR